MPCLSLFMFFFFNDTATTEIYTLSLHDALPISCCAKRRLRLEYVALPNEKSACIGVHPWLNPAVRSEEHTSELQSRLHLVCRLLLEKKKTKHPCTTSQTSCPLYTITASWTPASS